MWAGASFLPSHGWFCVPHTSGSRSRNLLETHVPPQATLGGAATWVSMGPRAVLMHPECEAALNPEKVPNFT